MFFRRKYSDAFEWLQKAWDQAEQDDEAHIGDVIITHTKRNHFSVQVVEWPFFDYSLYPQQRILKRNPQ